MNRKCADCGKLQPHPFDKRRKPLCRHAGILVGPQTDASNCWRFTPKHGKSVDKAENLK